MRDKFVCCLLHPILRGDLFKAITDRIRHKI